MLLDGTVESRSLIRSFSAIIILASKVKSMALSFHFCYIKYIRRNNRAHSHSIYMPQMQGLCYCVKYSNLHASGKYGLSKKCLFWGGTYRRAFYAYLTHCWQCTAIIKLSALWELYAIAMIEKPHP